MIVLESSGDHPWPWADAGDGAEAVFRATYPALHARFKPMEAQLRERQDKGRYWWELRSCAYYKRFDEPKLIYNDITWRQQFFLDRDQRFVNNTLYFVPHVDYWLVSVMNAPIGWWFAWRTLEHGKDEALRYFTAAIEQYPVPASPGSGQADSSVSALERISAERAASSRAIADWYRAEHGITDPGTKLADPFALDADGFVAELRRARGRKSPLSPAGVQAVRAAWREQVAPVQARLREAERLERELSDLVNAAYGLTPEEEALMWATAPPRMPIPPPVRSGRPT